MSVRVNSITPAKSQHRFVLRPLLIETLESRRLLSGQLFAGQGQLVSAGARTAVAADFNGDGHLDLATPNAPSTSTPVSLTIHIGDGAGGFTYNGFPPLNGIRSTSGASADFDGDGRADLVLAGTTGGLNILTGAGNGNFTKTTTISTAITAGKVLAIDVNTDGRPDLVTANADGSVSVLLGTGGGKFASAVSIAAGTASASLTAADLNADGKLDLAVTSNAISGTLSILLGDGAGGFGAPIAYAVGSRPIAVAAGDFDGDGKLDLATANLSGNSVSVLFGTGGGALAPAVSVAVGLGPRSVTAADLNGDGRADLGVANSTDNTITILNGTAGGVPTVVATLTAGTTPSGIIAADFTGDGDPDLAVANFGDSADSIFLNNGAGGFAPIIAASAAVGGAPAAGVSGDFNGDGRADLAVANSASNSVSVLPGNGDGTFAAGTTIAVGTTPTGIVAADFNADGKLDLATANFGGNSVSLLLGVGDGTFIAGATLTVGASPQTLAIGDFNNDGRSDLAVANRLSTFVNVLTNGGLATFTSRNVSTGLTSQGPQIVVSGDFNKDGKTDLAVTAASFPTSYAANCLVILKNNGTGTFTASSPVNLGFSGSGSTPRVVLNTLATADFNGDGNLDLSTAWLTDNLSTTLLGNGTGIFSTNYYANNVAGGAGAPVTADFNGDGLADVAFCSGVTRGAITLLPGSYFSLSGLATAGAIVLPDSPQALVVGDWNGDGRADLATINASGTVSTLLNRYRPNPYVTAVDGTLTVRSPGMTTIALSQEADSHLYEYTVNTPAGVEVVLASAIQNLVLGGEGVAARNDLGLSSSLSGVTVEAGANVTFATTQRLAALTIEGLATLANGRNLIRVTALTLGTAGRLDLNDNDLLLDYSPASDPQAGRVRDLIAAGRAAGDWTGPGLVSQAAKVAGNTTLGYVEASEYKGIVGANATFHGETLDDTAVLVRYTLSGDADLNGTVDFNDFLKLQNGFGQPTTTFAGGNFNYDSITDFNDFLVLQNNFGQSLPVPRDAVPAAPPPAPPSNKTASFSGIAFNDGNRNGKYDKGDKLATGKTIWLDLDDDGVKDAKEPSTVTDSQGRYAFKNLAAGNYRVRRVFTSGYVESTPARSVTLRSSRAVDGVSIGSKVK